MLRFISLLVRDQSGGSRETEQWRRARFRVYVFTILTISALALFAALIYNAGRAVRIAPDSSRSNDASMVTDP